MKSTLWTPSDFCVYLKNYKQNRPTDNSFDKNQGAANQERGSVVINIGPPGWGKILYKLN